MILKKWCENSSKTLRWNRWNSRRARVHSQARQTHRMENLPPRVILGPRTRGLSRSSVFLHLVCIQLSLFYQTFSRFVVIRGVWNVSAIAWTKAVLKYWRCLFSVVLVGDFFSVLWISLNISAFWSVKHWGELQIRQVGFIWAQPCRKWSRFWFWWFCEPTIYNAPKSLLMELIDQWSQIEERFEKEFVAVISAFSNLQLWVFSSAALYYCKIPAPTSRMLRLSLLCISCFHFFENRKTVAHKKLFRKHYWQFVFISQSCTKNQHNWFASAWGPVAETIDRNESDVKIYLIFGRIAVFEKNQWFFSK